jgi:hypothetical protein
MSKHETWFVEPKDGEEVTPASEKRAPVKTMKTLNFFSSFSWGDCLKQVRIITNVALTFLCFFAVGFMSWQAALFFQEPEFSEVKKRFAAKGQAAAGEWISEMGAVCRNKAELPMACDTLYESKKEAAMVANANDEGEHHAHQ